MYSGSSSGLMKMFANGVAVNPTYEAIGNEFSMPRIHLLIALGSLSGFDVFTEALSASSSIINRLFEP